ncbi:ScyD/ScyE family protein [Isoptericola sp. NPDC057559]|uniref:ScyD/ScyE family protein n=1 Tax=Isoptericola sp. NPDC057559 TaxID=3346168 RepID=UPI0036BB7190
MRRALTVVAAATSALLLAATPAVAHGKPTPRPPTVTTIASGLVSPLTLAAGPRGHTFVTQNFAGLLTNVARDGSTDVIYSSGGNEVGGVSFKGRTVTFTQTVLSGPQEPIGSSLWKLRVDRKGDPVGQARQVADLRAFENAHNPDGHVTYGLRHAPKSCLDQFPADMPGRYKGLEDSHPYGTTTKHGTTYVADAGMNAIVSVSERGRVRTVAVLPAQPAVVTAEAAAANGIPECAVGLTYWFEPVPTDVEVGPHGKLYVTTLPGGPEDASLGARGAVYTVDPRWGSVHRAAKGFAGATNVAVSSRGDVYVAELFGGRITRVTHHGNRTVVETPLPAGLEWDHGDLLATTNALPADDAPPDGHLVRIDLPRSYGHGH